MGPPPHEIAQDFHTKKSEIQSRESIDSRDRSRFCRHVSTQVLQKNRPSRAGAVAGSSLLLEPPFGTRSALAVVVPTRCSSLQLVFVLVSLLLNFHLIIFLCWLAEWRQTSTWNSCACATRCRSPPWGSYATHRCICGDQRIARVVQQPFSSNLLHVLWAAL